MVVGTRQDSARKVQRALTVATNVPPAAEPPKQPQSWWRKVARPFIVTLLGAALSVLILPAFTRQWDDRQKAHETKAAITQEIATATARAVGSSLNERGEVPGDTVNEKATADIANQWLLDRLNIEAKLRAYFSNDLVAQWKTYSELMLGFMELAETTGLVNLGTDWLDPVGPIFEPLIQIPIAKLPVSAKRRQYYTKALLGRSLPRELGIVALSEEVLKAMEALTKNLLAAEPAGFSTTRGDLLRDVLP